MIVIKIMENKLTIPDMVSKGIILNLFSIILITIMVYFLLPVMWDIDLAKFPLIFTP